MLSDRFLDFAAATDSAVYADWARAVARDDALLAVVERVPPEKRQPVLLFAAARFLHGDFEGAAAFRDWCLEHADAVTAEMAARTTQTNDVRRTAPVALALATAGIDGPVSLLEVGTSAGLGLFVDRYDVRLGDSRLGDASSPVRIGAALAEAAVSPGSAARLDAVLPQGAALPTIGSRAGLDLAPVDLRQPDARRWLRALLPPDATERLALLDAASEVALAEEQPEMLTGDAVDRLADLVALAPAGTAPVVVTSGTLVYLPGRRRQAFVDEIGRLGVRWVSYEKTGSLEGVAASADVPAPLLGQPEAFATLAVDGIALAVGDAHGTRLRLL